MNEDRPHWKKRLVLLKRNRSDNYDERGRRVTSVSTEVSPPPSSQSGSPRWRRGLILKLSGRVSESPSIRSAGHAPNPGSVPFSYSRQDPSTQTGQYLSPQSASVHKPNPGQATRSSTGEVRDQAKAPDYKGRIADARKAAASMNGFSTATNTASATNDVQSETNNIQSGLVTVNGFSSIIEPLKVFNSIANGIGKVHPYAQLIMSILTSASKMILGQANLDNAVCDLLQKVSEVYNFMMEDGRLAEISSMQKLYGNLAGQILECADFITHYSETKSAWMRLGKHILDDKTPTAVRNYSNGLDSVMQQCRDRAVRDTVINVHRLSEDLNFRDMVYVHGAGRDTSKCCLPGTREGILSEIEEWILATGEDVPRVFWLSGTEGTGKSAIAHTIANWFLARGGPGACFCFDRTREVDHRHERIFTTIARDLASRDPIMRRALANAVRDDNELRHTKDIIKQWKELILGPVNTASKVVDAPVLIVIDALDESGHEDSRKQILRMLTGMLDPFSSKPTNLPANLRVLVTSRLLEDISRFLASASHVRHVSMDGLSAESMENDIKCYVSNLLEGPSGVFRDWHFKRIAQKADGRFEWARLACEYIKGANNATEGSMGRFEDVVTGRREFKTKTQVNALSSLLHADAARRPSQRLGDAHQVPSGSFDDSSHRPHSGSYRSPPHNTPGRTSLSSLPRSTHNNTQRTPPQSRRPKWARDLFSGMSSQSNDQEPIEMQERSSTVVGVATTGGKRRKKARKAKKASAGISRFPQSVTRQSSGASRTRPPSRPPPAVSTSSTTPAVAANSATTASTASYPDATTTQAGCWTRFSRFVCCVSAKDTDSHGSAYLCF